ncbi:protein translocase subunit SecF [Lacibacterium aquatile]|uniref:Protein-export membrane protein SecF n=1 Tax=Lacibacterium aquatile TaxID=1168082 RepID=A0ABW5DPC1_9PROT
MYRLRFIKDNTRIQFMRGRFLGVATSAILSLISVVLFFHPGLNYGVDFRGGIVIEAAFQQKPEFTAVRETLSHLNLGQVGLQEIGGSNAVTIRVERQEGGDEAQQVAVNAVRAALAKDFAGSTLQRVDAVGATVSAELMANGMMALGFSMLAMLAYIWFRFEWQFGIGAVVTLLLDVTKTVGFYVIMDFQFNLSSIAAILAIMGYSINDKVVVYDRVRENLRRYKSMPLRELIDLSINETLNRTVGTSLAAFLSALPLVIYGGEALREFSIVMLFGIVIATTSSIFIAAPVLLFLGEKQLRRSASEVEGAEADAAPEAK